LLDSPEIDEDRLAVLLRATKARSLALGRRQRRWRSLAGTVAIAGVLAIAGTLVARPGPAPQHSSNTSHHQTAAPKWRLVGDVQDGTWHASTLSGTGQHYGLTCPTAKTCYVVEVDIADGSTSEPATAIAVTHDGGSTWQQSILPDGAFATGGLDCLDANTCITGGEENGDFAFFSTVDGGNTWTSFPGPSGVPASLVIVALSCTSLQSCVAIGQDSTVSGDAGATYYTMLTTDGGANWTDGQLASGFVPSVVQCFPALNCAIVGFEQPTDPATPSIAGEAMYSTDGGATWSAASVPSGSGPIEGLSCADSSDCSAVTDDVSVPGSQVLVTSDGGATWTVAGDSGLPQALLPGISCATSSTCLVGGLSLPASQQASKPIDIATAEGVLAVTSDGGESWQLSQVPGGLGHDLVTSVSCPSVGSCFALAWQEVPSQPASFVLFSYGS